MARWCGEIIILLRYKLFISFAEEKNGLFHEQTIDYILRIQVGTKHPVIIVVQLYKYFSYDSSTGYYLNNNNEYENQKSSSHTDQVTVIIYIMYTINPIRSPVPLILKSTN